jgi:hypothetical protein
MQSAAKKYQRYCPRCFHETRITSDFELKILMIEMAQTWQRLADQIKIDAALPNTPRSEPNKD